MTERVEPPGAANSGHAPEGHKGAIATPSQIIKPIMSLLGYRPGNLPRVGDGASHTQDRIEE